jgi:excisionase family DNA binding protein
MNLRKLAFTKQEAAYALACGVTKIDELIGTKQLAAVKSGRRVLISAAELERHLRELPPADIKPHHGSASKAARAARAARDSEKVVA